MARDGEQGEASPDAKMTEARLARQADNEAPPARAARRRRRAPDEARSEALACARRILIAKGPNGVTLQAVASEIGVTHGNLIHHFGSAAQLQSALMGVMVRDLAARLETAVAQVKSDEGGPRMLVDIAFDAFDEGGAAKLAAWIAVSNRYANLEPIRDAVRDLAVAIDERVRAAGGEGPRHVPSALILITLCAFGDAMIGGPLREMLGRDPESIRRLAARMLPNIF